MGKKILDHTNETIEGELKKSLDDLTGNDKEDGSGKKSKDTDPEKPENSEDRMEKIDEIFAELIDKVKDAPEAQQEALKILIGQMRQIGEQLKQVRDVKHFQEMKQLMVKHWDELNELVKGDPAMLKAVQEWGDEFVDSKVLYYELIGDVKDELIDKSQEVQEAFDDMLVDIGKVAAMAGWIGMNLHIEFTRGQRIYSDFSTGLDKVIENITDPDSHYFYDNLDVKGTNEFLDNLGGIIMKIMLDIEKHPHLDPEKKAEAEKILRGITENKKKLSRAMKDTSKIFRVIKKVRDTHFLKLYNEQPEQAAA